MLARKHRFLKLTGITLFTLSLGACEKKVETKTFTYVPLNIPNDTYISRLWAMKKIHAFSAWTVRTDCSAITTAIIDTGIDLTHEDLAGNLWTNTGETSGDSVDNDANGKTDDYYGWDWVNADNTPTDDNFHGTHVAGTIGAVGNNGVGVTGVCWKAKLMALKALDADGTGTFANVASAIDYAVAKSAKVINLSLGGSTASAALATAISDAKTSGVLVIAAAGNDGNDTDSTPHYPSSYSSTYDNLISVASTTKGDAVSSFSNYGTTAIAIAAPGEDILSTFPSSETAAMQTQGKTSKYEAIQGTSMSTPLVAGAATLIWAQNPTWTYLQVKNHLLDTAPNVGIDSKVNSGRRLLLGTGI